jgi:hypothetical protein
LDIIGMIAGWLAGQFMTGKFGCIVGALIGNYLAAPPVRYRDLHCYQLLRIMVCREGHLVVEGLSAEAPDINCWAAAMNDTPEGYPYPDKVRFEINQNKLSDYSMASQFLNINQTDIVCVQHEYGLFGGPAGSHLLKLLGDLRMPVVTTLHTVLKDPAPEYRTVMCKLSELVRQTGRDEP